MSIFSLTVNTDDNAAQVANLLSPTVSVSAGNVWEINRNWGSYFHSVTDGAKNTSTVYADTLVQATATITSTGTATADETVTVANIALTAVASGADPALGQWNVSGTVGTQATSIALAINTISTLTSKVTATSLAGVVTITSVVPGIVGNGLQISEAATNVTATAFSGGSQAHLATVSSNK